MTSHSLITLSSGYATRLSPEGVHSGVDITIQNLDETAFVYLGGEGVSETNFGYRLNPQSAIAFELPGKNAIYATTDSSGSQVAILKTGLEIGA